MRARRAPTSSITFASLLATLATLAMKMPTYFAFAGGFGFFMVIGWQLSLRPHFEPAIYWPATGFYFGAALIAPKRNWWILALCTACAWVVANSLTSTGSLVTWLSFWGSDTVSVLAMASLYLSVSRGSRRLSDSISWFVLIAGLILPALAATGGTYVASRASLETFSLLAWRFHFGALTVGTLTITPFMVSFAEIFLEYGWRAFRKLLQPCLFVIGPTLFVYYYLGFQALPPEWRSPILLLPIMAWISFRGRMEVTTLANLALSVSLLALTIAGRSSAALLFHSSIGLLTALQTFIIVNTLVQLLITGTVFVRSEYARKLGETSAELAATNAELARAKKEAELANGAKTRFLTSLSHEIRSPLGAMIGYLDLARAVTEADPATRNSYLEIAHRNGDHLHQLINRVLDLSKIEAGKIEVKLETTDLHELVETCLASFALQCQVKGLKLSVRYSPDLEENHFRYRTDSLRLRQILMNALSNAFKFTSRGEIRLNVERAKDKSGSEAFDLLTFDITDTGIGLSSAERLRLFQSFGQAHAFIDRHYGGTGLGLVVSKQFAELLGGDFVLLHSEKGVGSTFRLTIRAERVIPVQEIASKRPNHHGDLNGVRILVVDDAFENRELVRLHLEKLGARIEGAEDGHRAVESINTSLIGESELNQNTFDLVLMDFEMPVMDGREAARQIRRLGYSGPIIAMTGHAFDRHVEGAAAHDFTGFIIKPLSRGELVKTVDVALKKTRQNESSSRRPRELPES